MANVAADSAQESAFIALTAAAEARWEQSSGAKRQATVEAAEAEPPQDGGATGPATPVGVAAIVADIAPVTINWEAVRWAGAAVTVAWVSDTETLRALAAVVLVAALGRIVQ